MIGSYRGIIFRLTHNFCALHFVQVPQLCGHLAVIAGQRQTKGLQHKAGVPFPCLILIGCSLLQPLQNQTRAGFATAIQGAVRRRPQLPGGGTKSRQKLAAPRRVNGSLPRHRELCADADIQHQQSQQRQHGQPGCAKVDAPAGARAHDITGLADSDMPDFFRSAPHAGPCSHGCAEGLRGF